MAEQNLSKPETSEAASNESEASESFRKDSPFTDGGDFKLVQNQTLPEGEIPPELKQFLEMLMGAEGLSPEVNEPKERQSEGMKLFDKTAQSIDEATINAFRENQPQFRQAIKLTDTHLIETANQYVLEQYDSGRADRLTKGRDSVRQGVEAVNDELKKIPLHNKKVSAIELINGYLDPNTDEETKTALLDKLEESTSPKLASQVESLGKVQEELRPDIETETEKRAYVHEAYKESLEARQSYAGILSHTMKSPLVEMEEAKVMAAEMRQLESEAVQQRRRYQRHAYPPQDANSFRIRFPIPKAPRTIQA